MSKVSLLSLTILFVLTLCDVVEARRWRVDRRWVEADLIGANNGIVDLRMRNGAIRRVRYVDLNREDRQFVDGIQGQQGQVNVVQQQQNQGGNGVGNGRVTELLERSVQVQTAHYYSQWYDLWIIQFARRNGSLYWVAIPARDSYSATQVAVSRDPYSNILFVKRLNRR